MVEWSIFREIWKGVWCSGQLGIDKRSTASPLISQPAKD